MKNTQDLSRHIPEDIKREVRTRCYHSCIICGQFPWHYDHLGVEFKDATSHNADNIILLCGSHHDQKSRGQISNEFLRQKQQHPSARGKSPIWPTSIGPGPVNIAIGNTTFYGSHQGGISINGHPIFRAFVSADIPDQILLTGTLVSVSGREIVSFRKNEIVVASGSWDFQVKGSTLTVSDSRMEKVLELDVSNTQPYLRLNFLNMRLGGGYVLKVAPGEFALRPPPAGGMELDLSGARINGPRICLGTARSTDDNVELNFPELGEPDEWTNSGTPELSPEGSSTNLPATSSVLYPVIRIAGTVGVPPTAPPTNVGPRRIPK